MEDGGDLPHFFGERNEFFGKEGLHAIRESLVGLVMDFDEQAISADSDSGAGKRQNFVALAGAVAGINKNGEMAAFFYRWNDGEVERVAGEIGEGANAALAEHDVVIAFGEDVFGGHKEFVERGGHAALEEDRFFGAAGALEEGEILHVARANLDDVGIFFDQVEAFVVNRLGDDAQAKALANLREDFQARFPHALKAVRGSARLVGAAAEQAYSRAGNLFGDGHGLGFAFNGARTGNHHDGLAADGNFPGGSGNANDGVFLFGIAADQLIGLANGNTFDDAGKGFESADVNGAAIAGDADGGAHRAGNGVGFQTEAFDPLADFADLLFGGVGLHDD